MKNTMIRTIYSLEDVCFRNKDDAVRAREFLETGVGFEVDIYGGLYTEGGVYLGHVLYCDKTAEVSGLYKVNSFGSIRAM